MRREDPVWKTIPRYPQYDITKDGMIRNNRTYRLLKSKTGWYLLRRNNSSFSVNGFRMADTVFRGKPYA